MTLFWICVCVGLLAGTIAGLLEWQERAARKSAYERFAEAIREKLGKGPPGPPAAP